MPDKPIILLGEAWGENEEKIQRPFVGAAGVELLKMLADASVITWTHEDANYIRRYYDTANPRQVDMAWQLHPEVYRANVFDLRPRGNKLETLCGGKAEGIRGYPALVKSKYLRQEFIPQLERLGDEIAQLDPNLIVCLGNTPLWAMAGNTGVGKLRGTTQLSTHTAIGYKLLPTYHPANILRQWENRHVVVVDLIKAKRENAFPEVRRPARQIWIEPSLADMEEFDAKYLKGANIISVDIETAGNQVTCIGFSPRADLGIVIPFYDGRKRGRSYWPTIDAERRAWAYVKEILARKTPKVFQNGLYDIAFLWRSVGIKTRGATHDTMLLHHALQPESLKALGFLGSIYTDEGPWKSERHGTKTIKRDE
jgi:uracil-DNA glycosylase